jgi:hypothetical protein
MADGDSMFETPELSILGADQAKKAASTAKADHACHDFGNIANIFLCLGWYL